RGLGSSSVPERFSRTQRFLGDSKAPAAAIEPACERESAQLGGDLRGNGERMTQVIARCDVAHEATQRVAPERADVPEGEVVIACGMRWRGGAAVIAMRSHAAGGDVEMIDVRARLEADSSAGVDDAAREIGFESIRGGEKVFVEPADGDRALPVNGEIAGDDVLDVA